MLEYVYKLNFPALRDILLPGKYEELFVRTDESYSMAGMDPKTYLNPQHYIINNYEWEVSLLFYKADGLAGVTHTDAETVWAINYIIGGIGELRYFDPTVLGKPTMLVDPAGASRPVYDPPTQKKIDKKYMMPEGTYLVRTDRPHLPIGYGKRYSLSMRAIHEQRNQQWESTVESFKQYII
jgi:hypothetical protein